MDIAFNSICECICIAGPHGLSWSQFKDLLKNTLNLTQGQLSWPPGPAFAYILQILNNLKPNFRFGAFNNDKNKFEKHLRTKLCFFAPLKDVELETLLSAAKEPSSIRIYCPNEKLRLERQFSGRPIQLSESASQTLEIIASAGRTGLTQAELAKVLGCDSRNAFHWLKGLLFHDLVVRTPVAAKKSFTYLLTLSRYLDEEETDDNLLANNDSNRKQSNFLASSKEIRQSIVNILAKAPNQTMASREVFRAIGLDRSLVKNYRRATGKLVQIGWLEFVISDSFTGPSVRVIRLTRKPSDGLDLNKFLSSLQDSEKKEKLQQLEEPSETKRTRLGSDFKFDESIIHQIILLLSLSYPEPLTTADLSHQLNISRKYLYRIIDRIIPIAGKSSGTVGAEGVGKISEFVGKERTLKLFIKTEAWRNSYIYMFGAPKTANHSKQNLTIPAVSSYISSSSHNSSLNSSIPQSPSTPTTDTHTRYLRHQALLAELDKYRILDVGKELCGRLQKTLGNSKFLLDGKTLRRSANILEKDGLLKIVVVSTSSGTTRTLLLSPELNAQDPLVLEHIRSLSDQARTAPSSERTNRFLDQVRSDSDYFIEGSLPIDARQFNHQIAIASTYKFGFVFGVLARAELFHRFLKDNCKDQVEFDTIPTVFEGMPLGLYFKIIGAFRMSRFVFDHFREFERCPLTELPEQVKDELHLNKKRFQSQVILLLNILEQLKLIQGLEQGTIDQSLVNLKVPLKYKFALQVPLYNFKGTIVKLLNYTEVNEFWRGMRAICVDYLEAQRLLASIYTSTNDDHQIISEIDESLIPKPVLLARFNESWRDHPCRARELEQAVRKFAVECFKHQQKHPSENIFDWPWVSNKILEFVAEFEISREFVESKLLSCIKLLQERDAIRRQQQQQKLSLSNQINDEESSSDDEEDETRTPWSREEKSKLELAFCILQQDLFLIGPSTNVIKWNLATRLFDKTKSLSIRRHGLKIFKSYASLARILELDTIVQLVLLKEEEVNGKGIPSDSSIESFFKTVYYKCEIIINDELQDGDGLTDLLKTSQDGLTDPLKTANLLSIQKRREHYLTSIDSWIQTRIFRHGLLQNDHGLVIESHVESEREEEDFVFLKLRQILVASTLESFDKGYFEAASNQLKEFPSEQLNAGIDRLFCLGFASKNRARDFHRLFTFPLCISEALRNIIEASKPTMFDTFDSIVIDDSTDSLTFKGCQDLVQGILCQRIKFSMPSDLTIALKKIETNDESPFVALPRNTFDCIWNDFRDDARSNDAIIESVARNCFNHVEMTIRSNPGISISALKRKYHGLLLPREIDDILLCASAQDRIDIVESKYILPSNINNNKL